MNTVQPAGSIERHGADELKSLLKQAMRRLAATVCVITTKSGNQRYGMTATAVSSLSMDPASLLICINQQAETHGIMTPGRYFAVNLLAQPQADISRRFGSPELRGDARFAGAEWREDTSGTPFLADAPAAIICEVDVVVPYGSHSIFIGRVRDVAFGQATAPLLYYNGNYTSVTLS